MPRRTAAQRRKGWKIEIAHSFEEAEAQTRAYWKKATPAERLNALEMLRIMAFGKVAAEGRVERVLEILPFEPSPHEVG